MENREIKFRAWCSGKHKGLTFVDDVMDYEVYLSPKGFYLDVESAWGIQGEYPTIPIMQYTGLNDRNGKDIYEGDIVNFGLSLRYKYTIEFEDGSFVLKHTELKNENGLITWGSLNTSVLKDFISIEVIGNIYENPELLCK